jgi:flagellar biosynthetic protein FliR
MLFPAGFQLEILLLVLLRTGGFITAAPLFSSRGVPVILKVLLSVILSLSIYTYAFAGLALPPMSDAILLLYGIREILMGLTMGYVVLIVFSAVQIAGQLVDFQIGFSLSATYNPMSGVTQALMGRFYSMTALVLIFVTDAHHHILGAFYKSFEALPLGAPFSMNIGMGWILSTFSVFFAIAFQIAVPVILVLLMTDLVMGLVSRTVPSLNVLMLGMPMKTLVGLVFSMMALPVLIQSLMRVIGDLSVYLEMWIHRMS